MGSFTPGQILWAKVYRSPSPANVQITQALLTTHSWQKLEISCDFTSNLSVRNFDSLPVNV
ncbi:hypothetical protein V6Z11_D12G051200 [Gossypium hirsutum]